MKIILAVGIAATLFLQYLGAAEVGQWPPPGTVAVRGFSFAGGPKDLITDGNEIHPTARPKGGLLLTKEQAAKAAAALNATSNHFGYFYLCFEPRDALVFYDANGAVLASVSICFTCYDSQSVPSTYGTGFDYAALATFFASLNLDGGYKFGDSGASAYVGAYRKKVEEWRARRAKSAGRPVEPEPWKLAKPSATRRLSPGERVYISTSIPYDQFDGIKLIDSQGYVRPNLCKASVKIGGLTESDASAAVRGAAIKEGLYNDIPIPSITFTVVQAQRFQASGIKGEQPGAGQTATKPADKPPVKDQPSTPTPKGRPR